MFEVIYYSLTGNTKKLAQAIAEELGMVAQDVKRVKEPDKDSLLFLGSGCYGGRLGKEFMEFIDRFDFKGRKVALFGTCADPAGTVIAIMEKAPADRGAKIVGKFCCEGRFLFMNRKHPDAKDLENARNFAQEMRKL